MRSIGVLVAVVVSVGALVSASRQVAGDEWLKKPVDDRTFKTFLDLFSYDRSLPFATQTMNHDEQDGIRREHLSFQSTPGVRVFAHLYLPPPGGAPERSPALIMLHGGTGRGKENLAPPARNLARAGFAVLAIDMQYYGERSTDLLTTFTEQEKYDRLYNQKALYQAFVAQTVKDVSRSLDLLSERRGANAPRIGLVGYSRGALVGTIAAAVEQRLAAFVMFYGGHFGARERAHLAAACPANYIGRISPRPVLMLNGTRDIIMVKGASVDPLFRLARPPRQMLWSEGGHMGVSDQNLAQMLQWLRENVK